MTNARIRVAVSVCGLGLLAMLGSFPASAQVITGSITGSVVDASDSVVVGAKVTLTNNGTSQTQATPSDASGNFRFLLLPPGKYSIEGSLAGFKTFKREGIIVEADRSLGVPITLSVGEATQTVEVVGGTPLLEPNNSEVGTTVDSQKVMELPLNARDPMGLANLVPTVKGVGYFGGQILTSWRIGAVNIGGGQSLTNAYLMDGVPNDKMGDASGPNTFLTTDSTGEFKVITNGMSAEYGRTTGGVISAISKSGQNEYHGTAFDYLQNTALNANNFFANAAGQQLAPVHQNQFGGSASGRIVRDRIFFFADFEGFIQHVSHSAILASPTARHRAGDFSQTIRSNTPNQSVTIYDPLTTNTANNVSQPFPGNVVPASRISQFSQEFFSLVPLPNLPGSSGASNLFLIGTTPTTRYTGGGKVDWVISSTQRLAARITQDYLDESIPEASYFKNPLDTNSVDFVPRHSGFVSYTNTLSPTLVLDIRSGINRDYDQDTLWGLSPPYNKTNFLAALGLPQSFINQIPPRAQQFPLLTVAGLGGDSGGAYGGSLQYRPAYEWGEVASLTKIWREHTFKTGYQYTLYRSAPYNQSPPSFSFTAAYTQGPNATVSSGTSG